MKIIEAISDTNIGGAGVLLINRLSCTDTKKYNTHVLLPKGSALCKRLDGIGVKYTQIDCKGDKSFDISAIKEYKKAIKALKPDIINSHGALSARVAAYLCGVPIKICTRHCVFPITHREKAMGKINNLLSDSFIAVAHTAEDNLISLGVNPQKIHVIINGAAPLYRLNAAEKKVVRHSLGISDSTTVLGICARLEKCKGHECLLRAVKLLTDEGRDVCALIIGDGTSREYLVKLCREYGIEQRVYFCGFVKDTSPLMNTVDININCSVGTETSSLSLSEGMSLGIPAVVSNYGGNPYMIKKGVNGFVYPQNNHVKLAMYIKRLMDDRQLYRRMSNASYRRFCEELNAPKMTEKTCKLYDTLYLKMQNSRRHGKVNHK